MRDIHPGHSAAARASAASSDRIRVSGELDVGFGDTAERDLQGVIGGDVSEMPDATQAHDEERRPALSARWETFRRDLGAIPQPDAKRVTKLGYGRPDSGDRKTELRRA